MTTTKTRIAVYLLNNQRNIIKRKDLIKNFGGNLDSILYRDFIRPGYIKKVGRGQYKIIAPQMITNIIEKTKQTKQNPISVPMPKGILTRIHHIKGKIKAYAKDFQGWDITPINKYAWAARLEIDAGDGFIFTAQYNNTKHEYGTLSLNLQPITVNSNTLKNMATRINNGFQNALIWLNENYGFKFNTNLDYHVKDHYGVSLKALETGELPKTFNLNNYWFYDNSPGWPELETHQASAIKEIADLPGRVNSLEGKLDGIEANLGRLADSMEKITNHIVGPKPQPIKDLDEWDQGAYI